MNLVLKEKATFLYHNIHSFTRQQVLLFTKNKNIPQKVVDIMQNDWLK